MKMRNVSSLVVRFFELLWERLSVFRRETSPSRREHSVSQLWRPRALTGCTSACLEPVTAIALALAGGLDMGIDIECLGRGPDVARQAEIFCDARELRAMAAMPMASRVERLMEIWTLEERSSRRRVSECSCSSTISVSTSPPRQGLVFTSLTRAKARPQTGISPR